MRQWWGAVLLNVATLVITPVEMVAVNLAWLAFVAVVHYGAAHQWARAWIMWLYEWATEAYITQGSRDDGTDH